MLPKAPADGADPPPPNEPTDGADPKPPTTWPEHRLLLYLHAGTRPSHGEREAALDGERTGEAETRIGRRDRVFALAGVLAALLLAGLDQTIVATAGPEIQRDLRIPASLYAWITTAYLVASTVTLPIYGKLSDLYGRKRILLVGVGLFLLGSLLCGVSPGTGWLIAARAVQGLGAASLFTSTLAVIGDLFPPAERGKYMGLIGGVMGISSVVGPLVGGLITDTLGWHWVFFVNLPVGAVAVWLIVTRMPELGGRARRARIDVAGAVWLVAGVVPLLVALSLAGSRPGPEGGGGGADPATIAGLAAAGVVGILAFLRAERRAADPILDLRLFRDPVIGLGTAAMFVLGGAFLFSMIFLPLYLVNVLGVSATRAGLSLVPLTLGMVAGSVGSGQLVSRVGHYKRLLLGSLVLQAGAFAWMGWGLAPDTGHGRVTLMMVLVGLGFGPSLPLYTLIVQNAARHEQLGVVTAAATFARSMGQVIGVTVFGVIFALALAAAAPDAPVGAFDRMPPDALTGAVAVLYRLGILVVLVGLALTALIPEIPLRREHAPGPPRLD